MAAGERAKDEVCDSDQYAGHVDQMATDVETAVEVVGKAREVATTYAAYESQKKTLDRVDFGDLVMLPVKLLNSDSAILKHYAGRYDHILVDEYQDVNRSSVRLLQALTQGPAQLWVVGDARQSIYRFRGASSFNMDRFNTEDFPGGKTGRLEINYRSTTEIVDAFSSFASGMSTGSNSAHLDSPRGSSGNHVQLHTTITKGEQVAAVADGIRQLKAKGVDYRDQAVLCTGNAKLASIAGDLEEMGIPVLFLGSIFERTEVRDLISILTLLSDQRAMGLVRVACLKEFEMPLSDVSNILNHLRSVGSVGLMNSTLPSCLSPAGTLAIENLRETLKGFNPNSNPWEVLATVLLDKTRIAAQFAEATDVGTRAKGIAIWQFMNFVRTSIRVQGPPIPQLINRIRRLVRLGDDRDLRQLPASAQSLDAVSLMTIHGSKGLEFDAVHIPGMNADTIPRSWRTPPCPPPDGMIDGDEGSGLQALKDAHIKEQECLFYVGLSRARDHLLMYATTTKGGRQDNRPISSFIQRLGDHAIQSRVTPISNPPRHEEKAYIPVEIAGEIEIAASKLGMIETCPRRFFYTHILQVGGRREETPFTLVHEAVRSTCEDIVHNKLSSETPEAVKAVIASKLSNSGLADDGYHLDYLNMACELVGYFKSIRDGLNIVSPQQIEIKVGSDTIHFLPDDMIVDENGTLIYRRLRTGHSRKSYLKDFTAAALIMLVHGQPDGGNVEFVHLSDASRENSPLKDNQVQNKRLTIEKAFKDVKAGNFPAKPSEFKCPNCPAFIICGSVPSGTLKKKIRKET